ncbi:GntR family transcriptional regulator [Streptomyces sp. CA-100214]
MAIESIKRNPRISDTVTNSIRQAILAGELTDGQSLPLAELAARMDVSMMPVREALINLANEGLVVDHGRRGGYRVKALTESDRRDVYELHGFLQGKLAERAAHSITTEEIEVLRRTHDGVVTLAAKRRTKQVGVRLRELNNEFHRTINRIGEGDLLRIFLRSTSKFVREDAYSAYPEWVDLTLAEHPPIIEALAARNGTLARKLMEEHIAGHDQVSCVDLI